jgi:hypothetical protein
MVPPVLTELLSDPKLSAAVSKTLSELPLIEIQPGFWNRAGALRASVLAKHRKARSGDSLIVQSCLDARHTAVDTRPGFPRIRRSGVA